MGRPSVKAERTEVILNAFEQCIARYGVEGTSLEMVAEASGLSRSLLRHNVGNRDDMVEALAERFMKRSQLTTKQMLDELPEQKPSAALLEQLFTDHPDSWQSVLVTEALIAAASRYPDVQAQLHDWYEAFLASLAQVLVKEYPAVSQSACWDVMVAVVGIHFNTDSMRSLGLSERHRQAGLRMAQRLVASLET